MKLRNKIISFFIVGALLALNIINVNALNRSDFVVSPIEKDKLVIDKVKDDRVLRDPNIVIVQLTPLPLRMTVANWNMNERSGSAANDSTGHGYNGTISGAAWTPGISGTGLNFDGTSSKVTVADANSLDFSTTRSFTLSAWVNIPQQQNRWQGVVTKGRDTAAWYGIWISGDNKWVFGANGNNIYGSNAATGWHYVTAVQDGAAGKRYLYVDSVLSVQGNVSDGQNTGELWIGAAKSTNEYFRGTVDEVKLRNFAVAQSTISDEYKKYNPTRIAYWRFNEGTGTVASDSSATDTTEPFTMEPAGQPANRGHA